MKTNGLTDLLSYAFVVGGILVLTRPGSQGPKLLTGLTSGYTHIVQASTGQPISG